MSAACPTCGHTALPSARYCRACYTVFPSSTGPRPPQEKRTESRAWQLLVLLLIAGGGWWAFQSEAGEGEDRRGWSDAEASDDGSDGSASPARRPTRTASGERRRIAARAAPARAAPAARPWLLQLDAGRICGSGSQCEVTIRFASGAARFAVRRAGDSVSALVPAGSEGARLLSGHARATLVPEAGGDDPRPLAIFTLGGRRWIAAGRISGRGES